MRRGSLVLVVCLVLIASAAPALAAQPDSPNGVERTRVIVQLRSDGPSPRGLADQTVGQFGGRAGGVFESAFKGFVAELPQAAIDALGRNPNVVAVTPDRIVVSIVAEDPPTGYDRVEADLVPRGPIPTSSTDCPAAETCTDVDIAVIDTGIDPHPDLNVVQRTECNLLGMCSDGSGFDDHGHGSHVAGIAAAFDNDLGVVGIAPGARLWSVKVLDASGTGYLSAILAGVDWVTARAAEIDVVNMSLSGEFSIATFDTAIANSVAAGVTYVVAAGNSGQDVGGDPNADPPYGPTSPANHPDVITVSAVADADGAGGGLSGFRCRKDQTDDTLATFSNYGPAVDIAAPGVCILSTWRDGGYGTISGTSMASPQVAGAAALYIALRGRNVAQVKAALLADGIPQNPDLTLGGFTGDSDGFAEPLLFVNGSAFGGNGDYELEQVDSSPPSAPGALTAAADGFAVQLDWTAGSDPESGILEYRIYRDTFPSAGEVLVGEASFDATTYVDRATLPDTTYSYVVAAVNLQFGETRSNSAQANTSADDADDAGWWKLDDATGTAAADSSAWRRPATLVNSPAWSTGTLGGALSFDGVDDRVDFDHTVLDRFGDITAAMWVKTIKQGEQTLVSGANGENPNEYMIRLENSTNLWLSAGIDEWGAFHWTLPYSIADGEWHHLAVVRDDTRDRADLYLDGSWVGAWGAGITAIDVNPGGLLFGQSQGSVGGPFSGTVDDLRLYTRVLSAAEIADLAGADTTPPGAPSALSATTDVARVDLIWAAATDPESGIAAYEIWRGTGGDKTLLAEVPGTDTSYPDARTVPDTIYFYEVRAVNGSGLAGLFSPEAEAAPTGAGSGDPFLMGWWELDDEFGTVAADSSDYQLDGVLANGPTWDPGGQLDGALGFDGNDDRVDLDAQILDGATDVTVTMWVKTTKTGVQGLVSGANAGNDAEYEVVMLSNPDLRLRFYTGETNETHVVWPVPGIADGTWHHLAVTRDAAADQATLFVDGVDQGAKATVLNELSVDWGGLLLGQEQDTVGGGFDPTQSFEGSLDDVRLYRRVLSGAEIADLVLPPVADTTPPVITLLGDDPQTIEAGTSYVDAGATATDNIDGDVTSLIVVGGLPVDVLTPGTYLVTYDVVDSSGNAATQVSRMVDVVDTTAPVISLVGVDPVLVALNDGYVDAGASAFDVVDGDLSSLIVTNNPVDTAVLGGYTVTYDVSDAVGNAADQVVRTVDVVLDGVPPVITLLGDDPQTIEAGTSYVDAGATATDNIDGDVTSLIVVGGLPVDVLTPGTYLVTYDVVDSSGNAAIQVSRMVDVVDTTAPVISLVGVDPVLVALNDGYVDAGASAFDVVDGDLSSLIVTNNPVDTAVLGGYTVTYDVSDAVGNAADQVVRTVDVVLDGVPPVITLLGDDPQTIEAGTSYVDAGATATDNIDGDVTSLIVVGGLPVDVLTPGTYLVTYDVVDSSGNAATQVSRMVDVVDTTAPVISLVGVDPVLVALNDGYVDAGASAFDVVDGDLSSLIVTNNPVDTAVLGGYTVTYDVSDAVGNAADQVSRTVDVVLDGVPPVITLLGDDPQTIEAGTSYVDAGATATDNIDGDVTSLIVVGGLPVDVLTPGTYLVTYDVVDSSGNAAIQVSRMVDVVAAPVAVDVHAGSELTVQGAVAAGDLNATTASDDTYEVLAEHHQGGRPSQRVSSLDHRWTFEIGNPDHAVLIVEARRDANADGDDFSFEYSTDGTTFLPLLVVASASDTVQQAALPDGTSGTVTVRVIDTDRTSGNPSSDSVFIDELFLRTTTGSSGLPRVSVVATDPTAAESGPSTGVFTLTRSDSDGTLTVEIGLAGTAGSGDYQLVNTSVEFAAGSPTATVVITPIDDSDDEGPETVVVTIGAASGYEVGIPNTAEVTIADNDVIAIDEVALTDETVHGTAAGGLAATQDSDAVYEAITEEPHGGGKRSRLEHLWTFDVTGGSTVVFNVEAFRSNDPDEFVFAYSTDGAAWTDMLTVTKTADDDLAQTFALPAGTSGTVYVRVLDTDRTKSDPVLASVWVDHMFIRSG